MVFENLKTARSHLAVYEWRNLSSMFRIDKCLFKAPAVSFFKVSCNMEAQVSLVSVTVATCKAVDFEMSNPLFTYQHSLARFFSWRKRISGALRPHHWNGKELTLISRLLQKTHPPLTADDILTTLRPHKLKKLWQPATTFKICKSHQSAPLKWQHIARTTATGNIGRWRTSRTSLLGRGPSCSPRLSHCSWTIRRSSWRYSPLQPQTSYSDPWHN